MTESPASRPDPLPNLADSAASMRHADEQHSDRGDDASLKVAPLGRDEQVPRKVGDVPPPLFPSAPPPPSAEPFHFSIKEMFLLVTFSGVLLSILRVTGAAAFAAVTGVIAFVSLVILSFTKPERAIIHVAWWTFVLIYLIAAGVAIVKPHL